MSQALDKINSGRFGYCEITGEHIGLKRLETLPFNHIFIEALMEDKNKTWQ